MRVFHLEGLDLQWSDNPWTLTVWNSRPSSVGMPAAPVFYLREITRTANPDPAAGVGCFNGIYNPDAVPLNWTSMAHEVRPVILCPDPDSPEGSMAFRLYLRDSHGSFEHVIFEVHRVATGESVMRVENGPPQRVRLASGDTPFSDHPEVLGALFAVGLVPIKDGFYLLER